MVVFRWAAAGKRLLVCTIQVAIFKASRVHDALDSYASATHTFNPTPQLDARILFSTFQKGSGTTVLFGVGKPLPALALMN